MSENKNEGKVKIAEESFKKFTNLIRVYGVGFDRRLFVVVFIKSIGNFCEYFYSYDSITLNQFDV